MFQRRGNRRRRPWEGGEAGDPTQRLGIQDSGVGRGEMPTPTQPQRSAAPSGRGRGEDGSPRCAPQVSSGLRRPSGPPHAHSGCAWEGVPPDAALPGRSCRRPLPQSRLCSWCPRPAASAPAAAAARAARAAPSRAAAPQRAAQSSAGLGTATSSTPGRAPPAPGCHQARAPAAHAHERRRRGALGAGLRGGAGCPAWAAHWPLVLPLSFRPSGLVCLFPSNGSKILTLLLNQSNIFTAEPVGKRECVLNVHSFFIQTADSFIHSVSLEQL